MMYRVRDLNRGSTAFAIKSSVYHFSRMGKQITADGRQKKSQVLEKLGIE